MSMTRHPSAVFYEVQPIRHMRVSFLMILAGIFMIVFMGWVMYDQLFMGRPFGDNPMPDSMLVWFGPLYVLLGAAVVWLYFAAMLITEVRPDGIYVRYKPFHRNFKRFGLDELEEFEARKYSPIRDYGGWGIRAGAKGRAYNVHGTRGVQFVFKDGKRLLIGSQAADTMVDAIRSVKR